MFNFVKKIFEIVTKIFLGVFLHIKKEKKMNISTDYSNSIQQYSERNNKPQNVKKQYQTPSINNIQGDSVSFKGAKMRKISRLFMSKEAIENLNNFTNYASGALRIDSSRISSLIFGESEKRINFFSAIVEKYHGHNFEISSSKVEDPEIVINLFQRISKPSKHHIGFIHNTDLKITEIDKCFRTLEDDSKKIKTVNNIYNKLGSKRNELTMQMIESPNREEYIQNFEQYRPFIENHYKDKDIIKQLDTHLENNTYNKDKEKNLHTLEKAMEYIDKNSPLKKEEFIPNFSEEGATILRTLAKKFYFTTKNLSTGNDKEPLLNIYKTTNKNNIKARIAFLETYTNCGYSYELPENEIECISTLFNMMDENPKISKFVRNLSEKNTKLSNSEDYITLINNVDIDVLNRDVNKLTKVARTQYFPSQAIFDFYRNEPHSVLGRILKSVKGFFTKKPDNTIYAENLVYTPKKARKTEYTLIAEDKKTKPKTIQKPVVKAAGGIQESYLPAIIYHFSALEPKPAYQPVKLPPMSEILAPQTRFKLPDMTPVQQSAKPIVEDVKATTEPIAEKITKPERTFRHLFKQRINKQPSAKKLAIITDVNSVIEKKLGSNVYADQSRAYASKATKMRLGMLPEIFESIKETRAAERKSGIFNKHKSVKNEDAFGLYRRINGKNKRLVNYMLKVRNEDGTRKYNVKDIVETLDNANRQVLQAKATAPKEAPFMAKDEKALYSNLVEKQIEQYGKLPIKRSKKS